jgi:pimeloyl-ACP methyl ester carboxylesterase
MKIYYEIHGSGKPMVALHGGLQTIDLAFGSILPELSTDRQVVAVELQGHGHTPDTERPLTLPNLAGDIVELLDELRIERADLFGFSLGGLVALQAAMSHPERVDRLIAASTQFRSDGFHVEIRDPKLWATSTRMPTEADFRQMHEAYRRVAPDPEHFEAFQAKIPGIPDTVDEWTLDGLSGITAPTLLIIGDHDFIRIEHAAQMHELIPGSRLAVLPKTTHLTLTHRTELLLPMVREFLAG